MGALSQSLRALGAARLIAMAGVAAIVAGLLVALIAQGGTTPMVPLYADLDLREAGQIADQLEAAHIAHAATADGTGISVAQADVPRARLLLARAGLPTGGGAGWELFDKSDGLTATQFQQQVTQLRALEGELSRSIRTIAGVRAARVHLVLPRREPFERDRQDAQAGVLLTMAGGARLDREAVQAVVNLVSAAVPGLRPQNVAIVDSRGDVLARAGEPVGEAGAAQGLEEMRHGLELRLSHAVEEMLERTLGPGRVRAEAAVEFDTASLHETQEKYDPDGKVERSTQSVTDSSRSTEAAPSVSVQNNLPNADAGAAQGTGTQQQRQEETTNFEIGRTVRTLVREQPELRRISLAVLVDGTEEVGKDGTSHYAARPQDEIDRIATLVKSAIGFDEKRGDKVDVVNMRFVAAPTDADATPVAHRLLGVDLGTLDAGALARTAVLGVLGMLALLFVLRPMVRGLGVLAPIAPGDGLGADLALAGPGAAGAAMAGAGMIEGGRHAVLALTHDGSARAPGGTALALAGGGSPGAAGGAGGGDDAMVDLLNIEGQIRASSIRRLADMVEKHPEESLTIIRGWMQQEPA